MLLLSSTVFSSNQLLQRFFQEHSPSVNHFEFCRSWSGFKLFAKVISRCPLLAFLLNQLLQKFFHEHSPCVKHFESRSGPMFCRSWSGFKLFAKVINRRESCWEQEKGKWKKNYQAQPFSCWIFTPAQPVKFFDQRLIVLCFTKILTIWILWLWCYHCLQKG